MESNATARKVIPSVTVDWVHYPVTMDNWVDAVQEEVRVGGLSFAEVARRIGYARPSLSLAIHGKYVGDVKTIAGAYIEYRKQLLCPYTQTTVGREYCSGKACGDVPTHNPSALRHWRVCQGCEFKPVTVGDKVGAV
ncbi:MAG: hypothetical protein CR991_11805 [Proteobacteria bacterium]|nr:MAG: hypothetical protein CR991_11805 [Pseudomonadota bacterium]